MNTGVGDWRRFNERLHLGHDPRCVLADREGRLWVGSRRRGLSRHDGHSLENFTTRDGLACDYVRCLLQSRSGDVWVGTDAGLSRYDDDDGFVTLEDGPGANSIRSLMEDRRGVLWIGARGGVYCLEDGVCRRAPGSDELRRVSARALAEDRDGAVWIGTDAGLYRLHDDSLTHYGLDDGLPAEYVTSLCLDSGGRLWVGTYRGGLCRRDGDGPFAVTLVHGLPSDHVSCLYEDRQGRIWIGTAHDGVGRYDDGELTSFSTRNGLAHNCVHGVAEDGEGGLWLACWHGGLSYLVPGISRISDDPVQETMVADTEGRLYWGSGSTLVSPGPDGERRLDFEGHVHALLPDSRGRLWVATDGGGVFVCPDRSDILGAAPEAMLADLPRDGGEAQAIYEDAQGRIWIATTRGAIRHDETETVVLTTRDGLPSDHVSAVFQDASGVLWFGSHNGGGLTRYDGERFHTYTTADGLAHDEVLHIAEDQDGNLWIATREGVSRFDGESFTSPTTRDGLPSDTVKRVLVDRRGGLWGATLGEGVFQYDGKNVQALTVSDGLPSNYVSAIVEDADGRIVIATYRGIRAYDRPPAHPPSVRITGVDAATWHDTPSEVTVPLTVRRIRIEYRGVSAMTARMRYNYALEGYDPATRSTWDEHVIYENLPLGDYRFKVQAVNRDLVASAETAEVRLQVVPYMPDDGGFSDIAELGREVSGRVGELTSVLDNLQRTAETTDHLVGAAHCRLWRADVEEYDGAFAWTLATPDTAELRAFMPLDIRPDEEFSAAWERSVLPEDRSKMDETSANAIREGRPGYRQDYRYIDNTGAVRWVHEDVAIKRLEATRWALVGVVTDITERKEAEAFQRTLSRAMEQIGDTVVITNRAGTIEYVNPAFEARTGFTAEEAIGNTPAILKSGEHDDAFYRDMWETILSGRTFHDQFINRTKDGEPYTVEQTVSPIRDDEGRITHFAATGRDMAERRAYERSLKEANARLQEALTQIRDSQEQAIEQERLRALGEMASGIAHDFNNALSPILGFADLLLMRPENLANTEKATRYLEIIRTAAEDAGKIVGRLKEFYRRREASDVQKPVDLDAIINEAVALTQPKWKDEAQAAGIDIRLVADVRGTPSVSGSASELREALANLIFNACDAMPSGGTILLRAYTDAEGVVVEVKDTGIGMSPDVRRQCLDPFFTTKDTHGTGMGLAMVYGIVQRHEGHLDIESQPGEGTTFILRFPVPGEADAEPETEDAEASPETLRVLVVEDEPRVREVVVGYLDAAGHQVAEAEDGERALAAFSSDDFDLVITDRAMPGMSGDHLAAEIRRRSPDTPIVMLTGFGSLMDDLPEGVDVVLGKPITMSELLQSIATLIGDDDADGGR